MNLPDDNRYSFPMWFTFPVTLMSPTTHIYMNGNQYMSGFGQDICQWLINCYTYTMFSLFLVSVAGWILIKSQIWLLNVGVIETGLTFPQAMSYISVWQMALGHRKWELWFASARASLLEEISLNIHKPKIEKILQNWCFIVLNLWEINKRVKFCVKSI